MFRVRFAPSPTGGLHPGGIRTALFNYLLAKQKNGKFILRIEDTDQTRFVEGAEQFIIDSLSWCGLEFDEGPHKGGDFGPYRQSERKDIYAQYAQQLIDSRNAYYAFDTPEELDILRKKLEQEKASFQQYGIPNREKMKNSLTLSADEVQAKINSEEAYVIRFKMPENELLTFKDMIRGEIQVNTNQLDDKVLVKADGMPTYHLANIVDDYLMKISHVIRGEEWLPSLPLHVLLYRSFGWLDSMPQFAHLSLLLKPVGQGKLSKRDAEKFNFPFFALNWKDPKNQELSIGLRESGYLPEAYLNFLASLGWHAGDGEEIYNLEKLIEQFSVEKLSKSGAKYLFEKMDWYNQQYIKNTNNEKLAKLIKPQLEAQGYDFDQNKMEKIVALMKERWTTLNDFWESSSFFFEAPKTYDEKVVRKKWKNEIPNLMLELKAELHQTENFTAEKIEEKIKSFAASKEIGMGMLMQPFRLCLTGKGSGASLFDTAELIGKKEVITRIETLVNKF